MNDLILSIQNWRNTTQGMFIGYDSPVPGVKSVKADVSRGTCGTVYRWGCTIYLDSGLVVNVRYGGRAKVAEAVAMECIKLYPAILKRALELDQEAAA